MTQFFTIFFRHEQVEVLHRRANSIRKRCATPRMLTVRFELFKISLSETKYCHGKCILSHAFTMVNHLILW